MKNGTIYFIAVLFVSSSCVAMINSSLRPNILKKNDNLAIHQNVVDYKYKNPSIVMDSCINCDIEAVIEIKANIDNLTENQVYNFLCCLDESCSENVEFTEFSNEVLYLLLSKRPELALKVLSINTNISLNYVKMQLENPVSDKIDANNVFKMVEGVENYETIKNELLSSIRLGIVKYY